MMLRSLHCISSKLSRAHRIHQIYLASETNKASISTNAAINNSLRYSQYDRRTSRASLPRRRKENTSITHRRSSLSENSAYHNHEHGSTPASNRVSWLRSKPGHDPKAAVKLSRSSEKSSAAIRDRARHKLPRDDTNTGTSQYDYSRKPGGNRAARRAARFGDKESHESDQELSPYLTSSSWKGTQARSRTDSSASRRDRGIENTRVEQTSGSGLPVRQDVPNVPLSIPYTTPASEFLYGASVVISALRASRRKLYKLYVYQGDNRDARNQDTKIVDLAGERKIRVERVRGEWLRVLDKMSGGRPHNVRFLLTSCLPKCSNS